MWKRSLEEYVDGRNKIFQRPKNIVKKTAGGPFDMWGLM